MDQINISQARRRGVEKQETVYPSKKMCHVQLRCHLAVAVMDNCAHVHQLWLCLIPIGEERKINVAGNATLAKNQTSHTQGPRFPGFPRSVGDGAGGSRSKPWCGQNMEGVVGAHPATRPSWSRVPKPRVLTLGPAMNWPKMKRS